MTVTVHAAGAVLPGAADPIPCGAVAVDGERIVAVGGREAVLDTLAPHHPDVDVVTWDGVLTPGLVNAHTHLQYTSFGAVGALRHETYVRWAESFVAEYDARRDEDWRATALAGIEAGLAAGTTCFGDVVTDRVAMDVLVAAGVAGVAYYEIIGVDEERWHDETAAEVAEVLGAAVTSDVAHVGLSPHAPYSVPPDAMRLAVAWARRHGLRIHSHVAEIAAEDELYRTGTGWWADRIRVVARRESPYIATGGLGMGTAELAASVGLIGPDVHLAHGVYLDAADRRRFADAGTIVALCPRSNRTVGSDGPPVADFLREGIPFAVGTDSLGSNDSLDLLADVAVLRDAALAEGYTGDDLDAVLFAGATTVGAQALGLDAVAGRLRAGRRADLAVFDVDPADALAALVAHGAGRCVATVVAGERRGRRSPGDGT